VGLSLRDLFADSVPDKKALREAEQKRAAEDRELRRKRWAIGRQIDLHWYWRKRADGLAKALMDRPQSDRLNALFLSALDKARMLDESVVTQICKLNAKFHKDDFVWGA
jgi:DNA-nicking Smr family endonuclease